MGGVVRQCVSFRFSLAEVGGRLPDNTKVRGLRPLGEPGELQVLVHALAKREAHEWVLFRTEG
jgi:hypothetical protein